MTVGKLKILLDDETAGIVRWTVENFQTNKWYSDIYCDEFRLVCDFFRLKIKFSVSSPTYGVAFSNVTGFLRDPCYWKLSVEGNDIRISKSAKQIPYFGRFSLGASQDVESLLDPNGSLVVLFELRRIQEGTTDALSPTLQHPGSSPLARDFGKLLLSGEATDATVRVKGEQEFPVHRAVLVARIPVFSSMFRHRMSETESGVVKIEDCDPDTFRRFLHFVYTAGVNDLCPENAVELYRVADKYQVDELKSQCLEYISGSLSVQSFCSTISLALQHCERELTERSTEFFTDNIDDIVLTVEWQDFMSENPIQANELIIKGLRKKNALLQRIPLKRETKN